MPPAEAVELGDVRELAHGAVGLVGVEDQVGEIHPLHEVRGRPSGLGYLTFCIYFLRYRFLARLYRFSLLPIILTVIISFST